MLLVVTSQPDSRRASTKTRRAVNLFKKLLGKQSSFPALTPSKSRPENKLRKFHHTGPVTEGGDSGRVPELDTPTSACRLYWDCANTVYCRSVDLRTPISPNESPAFCDIPLHIDKVPHQTTEDPRSKEIPSPKQLLNHDVHTSAPSGGLVILMRPPSPSECPINITSSTDAREHNVSQGIGSENEEEDPGCPVPRSSPPTREEGMRRVSLMLRPVSGGPAPQGLFPPPVKVRFPARRGVTLPLPHPQRRSRQSIMRSQPPYEFSHTVSQPGSPTSLTPEEGLVQLQVPTRNDGSSSPLGYTRSVEHGRALYPRALPTPPLPAVRPIRPLPLPPITAPVTDHPNNLNGDDIRSQYTADESDLESLLKAHQSFRLPRLV